MKALVWPVATYGCESWTLRKNEETRLDAFEMKGLRKILRVSWTAKKTNEWVLNNAGVKRELLDTVKARKLAYYGHTMRKQGSCLEKEIGFFCLSCGIRQGGVSSPYLFALYVDGIVKKMSQQMSVAMYDRRVYVCCYMLTTSY